MLSAGDTTTQERLADIMIGSVHDVFLAHLSMEVFPGPLVHGKGALVDDASSTTEVSVIVGFNGALNGGLRFSCPLSVALALAGTLVGRVFIAIGAEVDDALAQLTNGIAGSVRTRFCQQDHRGEGICLTPPALLSGHRCDLSYGKRASTVKQTFQVEAGPFFVECFYLDVDPWQGLSA